MSKTSNIELLGFTFTNKRGNTRNLISVAWNKRGCRIFRFYLINSVSLQVKHPTKWKESCSQRINKSIEKYTKFIIVQWRNEENKRFLPTGIMLSFGNFSTRSSAEISIFSCIQILLHVFWWPWPSKTNKIRYPRVNTLIDGPLPRWHVVSRRIATNRRNTLTHRGWKLSWPRDINQGHFACKQRNVM